MNGRTVLYLAGLVAVGLFTWGLASSRRPATGSAEVEDARNEVLATVEGEEISRWEVETNAGSQLIRLRQQVFQLTDQTLAQTIDGKILDLEAGKNGLDRYAFLAAVIDSNPPVPLESQIDSVYEQFRDRIEQPRESVVPQIEAFLVDRAKQARFDSLMSSLRDEYEVVNYLEPPRFEVAATGPALGPDKAPVTIVEFSDFECPFCLRVVPTLERILEDYGDDVRLVFRQFPLNNIHPNAQSAAEASLCAADQSRFWQYHDALFAAPGGLDRHSK